VISFFWLTIKQKRIQEMENPASGDFHGFLYKKKMDHGRFEDPYRNKFQCWIHKVEKPGKPEAYLCIRGLGPDKNPVGTTEKVDLSIYKVQHLPKFAFFSFLSRLMSFSHAQLEKEEKHKFSLIGSSQEQHIKLKAETVMDAEEWMQNIAAAIKLVIYAYTTTAESHGEPCCNRLEATTNQQILRQSCLG
jgi:hypothetical protein